MSVFVREYTTHTGRKVKAYRRKSTAAQKKADKLSKVLKSSIESTGRDLVSNVELSRQSRKGRK